MAITSEALRQQVFDRARHCYEYCQTARRLIGMPLVVDHVIPVAHGGTDDLANLATACYRCNEHKGARMHGVDPQTGETVPLFNPRRHQRQEHFYWANDGIEILGKTAIGRATVQVLRLNNDYIVESRTLWVHQGWHPPREP